MNSTLHFVLDNYPNYLPFVPKEYWDLPVLPRYLAVATVVSFLILMCISLGANSLMVIVFIRHRSLRTPPNKLVINMSVSSFFMHFKSWVPIVNGLHGGPVLGRFGCLSFGGFGTVAGLSEIWTITFMAVERCRAICSIGDTRPTNKQINYMLGTIWGLSTTFAILPLLGVNGYVTEPHLLTCTFDAVSTSTVDKSYLGLLIFFAWFVPLATITTCYTKIFLYTRGTRSTVKEISKEKIRWKGSNSKTSKDEEAKIEMRLAMKLLAIICIWICAWTPAAVVAFLQLVGYGHHVSHPLSLVALLSIKTSSVINSFVYGLRLPKFRNSIVMLFRRQQSSATDFSSHYPYDTTYGMTQQKSNNFRRGHNNNSSSTELMRLERESSNVQKKETRFKTQTPDDYKNIGTATEGNLIISERNVSKVRFLTAEEDVETQCVQEKKPLKGCYSIDSNEITFKLNVKSLRKIIKTEQGKVNKGSLVTMDSFGNSDSQFKGIIDFDKFSVVGEICGVKYFIEDSVKDFVLGDGKEFFAKNLEASFHVGDVAHGGGNPFEEAAGPPQRGHRVVMDPIQQDRFVRCFSTLMRSDFQERIRPNLRRQLAVVHQLPPSRETTIKEEKEEQRSSDCEGKMPSKSHDSKIIVASMDTLDNEDVDTTKIAEDVTGIDIKNETSNQVKIGFTNIQNGIILLHVSEAFRNNSNDAMNAAVNDASNATTNVVSNATVIAASNVSLMDAWNTTSNATINDAVDVTLNDDTTLIFNECSIKICHENDTVIDVEYDEVNVVKIDVKEERRHSDRFLDVINGYNTDCNGDDRFVDLDEHLAEQDKTFYKYGLRETRAPVFV